MQTYQRLLTALIIVTFIPLVIYFSVGMAVQKKILVSFEEVGGKVFPGNIATARMISELYHVVYMAEKYAISRENQDRDKIEELIANLDLHVAMHIIYHRHTHDKGAGVDINDFMHRFLSFISEYILLVEKNASRQELHVVRMKIDQAMEKFVSNITPVIDGELKASAEILNDAKVKNRRVFHFLTVFGFVIVCSSIAISIYISRRFRALDKENENFKNNLESLVARRTTELNEKNRELESEIGERKRAESELRNSERYLKTVFDSSIPLCLTSIDFEILRANKSYYQIWPAEASPPEIVKCYESRHGSLCHTNDCPVEQIKNGATEVVIDVRKDESERKRDFIITARPFFDETGGLIGIVESFQEITEWKRAEEEKEKLENELRQAQKMESIGTLAGGIAHDFNNILAPIYGYVEMALLNLPDDHQVKVYLERVLAASFRARDLVKQILTFSRRETEKRLPLEPQSIIKEALKLLRASLPSTIEIHQNIVPDCGMILANPTQLHQVIMNLCTNAYHAMRETGGILNVSLTPYAVKEEDAVKNIHLRPGSYLRLEVSDTGHGMDKAIVDRIFEPYFTTKRHGEGTGLGLSVAHGIIKSHGGHITVYSELGQGTTFHVYLPLVAAIAQPMESLSPQSLAMGSEKIMLVDDEDSTLEVARDVLTNLGYEVAGFSSPLDALEHFRHHVDQFDIIVTDMTMPKMTGDKFAAEVKVLRPGIPVILCTGFSEMITEEKAKDIGIAAFLTKPVPIHIFASAIRKALDERA